MMKLGSRRAKAYCALLWAQEYTDSALRSLNRLPAACDLPYIESCVSCVEENLNIAKRELEDGVSPEMIKLIEEKMMPMERL